MDPPRLAASLVTIAVSVVLAILSTGVLKPLFVLLGVIIFAIINRKTTMLEFTKTLVVLIITLVIVAYTGVYLENAETGGAMYVTGFALSVFFLNIALALRSDKKTHPLLRGFVSCIIFSLAVLFFYTVTSLDSIWGYLIAFAIASVVPTFSIFLGHKIKVKWQAWREKKKAEKAEKSEEAEKPTKKPKDKKATSKKKHKKRS